MKRGGFTLAEVVVAVAIIGMVMSGIIYGYVQTNNQAQWSSMSLVAQSLAVESVEQARAAKWEVYTLGGQSGDELPPGNYTYVYTNAVLAPATGQTTSITNNLQVTTLGSYPPMRQIRADCWWKFPPSGRWFTNSVVTVRAGN